MRNRLDTNQACTGLVQQYIGTAYDVVKTVYDNLDTISEVGDRLGSLEYYRKLWTKSAGECQFEWEHDTKTIMVYLNGSCLVRDIDYQADGTTITLAVALVDDSDMLEAHYSAAYDVPGCVDSNTYFSEQGVQNNRLTTLESSDTAQNTKISEITINDQLQNTDIDALQVHAGTYTSTDHVKNDGSTNQVYTKFSNTAGDHGWITATGLERKSEEVSGTGNIEDDVNAYTFVGPYADTGVLVVSKSTVVSLGHDGIIYDYIGPTEVEIGAGAGPGTYTKRTCTAADFLAVGVAAHGAMSGRSDLDQHPTSAITNLDTDQTAQDDRLTALEAKDTSLDAEQAVQDTRLDNLEAADVTNDARVGVLEGRVDTIDVDQVTQNNRLDAVEPKVTALEANDISQDTEITDNGIAITNLQTSEGVQDGRLDALETNTVNVQGFIDWALLKFCRAFGAGNGAADPTLTSGYNIASVVRQGVGNYRGTVTQNVFWGVTLTEAITHLDVTLDLTSTAFASVVTVNFVSAGVYDIQVSVLDPDGGGPGKMGVIPYDLEVGDTVHVLGWYDANTSGTLPPTVPNT